jgi:serine protease AprX
MIEGSMRREILEEILYSGRMARRFTQDSPILPDVWLQYALGPGKAYQLLITPWQQPGLFHTTPGMLSVALRRRLKAERLRGPTPGFEKARPRSTHIAYNVSTVVAELWFDELVRVVLPLSNWWQERVLRPGYLDRIGDLEALQEDDDALLALNEPVAFRPRIKPDPEGEKAAEDQGSARRELKLPDEILWMIRVVGTIALINRHTIARKTSPDDWPPRAATKPAERARLIAHLRTGAVSCQLAQVATAWGAKRWSIR